MNSKDRITAFEKLGNYLLAIDKAELEWISSKAVNENSWFANESVSTAIEALSTVLTRRNLEEWLSPYKLQENTTKTIAVVMAGNIPLVGFHDLLSILITGNRILIKPSSKDSVLLKFVINKLLEIEPRFRESISFTEQLKNFDAVIATGSDNSSRYFEYYFSKYPHIIRKNRSSCALLTGFENEQELYDLGKDVFTYFGLGCRNVSKLLVPNEFDFTKLLNAWTPYKNIMHHHKYHNNYDYQKSILLVNRIPFLDSEFVLLQENERLLSPISVVFYEFYDSWEAATAKLKSQSDKIQCIVGNAKPATVKIGQAQLPQLNDYADQIDTIAFLQSLQ
ncbi:acyl-CoA reductase [Chryseosolibacter indicus]|uniref:Acyl-CoA reductase n=1 Tax=Chryseosolibacter indicus TaxID=2782351 RepID=A0ABS5VPP1_9BACT|nr:acyl-CoA reductase [Chryseosolibacter indicus]MBT1703410.1 acyl-CoA reductase [Chryseosolibacter indicus]